MRTSSRVLYVREEEDGNAVQLYGLYDQMLYAAISWAVQDGQCRMDSAGSTVQSDGQCR